MASNNDRPTVKEFFSSSSKEDIISFLGSIYEHSSWVAEELCQKEEDAFRNIDTVTSLSEVMKDIVNNATKEKKTELLFAHPDLCNRAAKLTESSQEEQKSAGLTSLTEIEYDKFTQHNSTYRTKFGFPFILAVRKATKYTVLSSLEGRLSNTIETEFLAALNQVHKIAWMRLLAAFNTEDAKGFLTCHVLDTANGCPAAKMRIQLRRLSPPESSGLIGEYVTNDDGRLDGGPALKGGKEFTVGIYEWTFFVSDYFASKNTPTAGTPFLDVIPLRFGIDNPDDHYHVPLLVSPWSFSTYRGS